MQRGVLGDNAAVLVGGVYDLRDVGGELADVAVGDDREVAERSEEPPVGRKLRRFSAPLLIPSEKHCSSIASLAAS
jgi:hypothetical protein